MLKSAIVAAALLAGTPLKASTVLDVGGPRNQAYTIRAGTAAAVAFSIAEDVKGFSIEAPILCISCSGSVFFNRNRVGPSADIDMTLAGKAFGTASTAPLFSFDTLAAGSYFLIVAIDASSTGSALWSGSTAPVVTGSGGRGLDFTAASLASFVPRSDYRVNFDLGLAYTVRAADAPPAQGGVPEPSSWLTLIGGSALIGTLLRRRRSWARGRSDVPHAYA